MKYPQLVSMPSAVSDWLEEQLEARGIDAVVYARYILSLLHSDPVDVIYSDEDLHFSHLKKEVRRSSGGRKRLRRSSEWWKYAQADAEKLKRSAAVECLMSASDQTCGIESLIDELCEKLKEIESDAPAEPVPLLSSSSSSSSSKKPDARQQVSPQELAKRYYAAFPPLSRNSTATSPATLLSLIPKWIPSPKKKGGAAAGHAGRKHHATRSGSRCEEKLHARADHDGGGMKARAATRQQRIGAYIGRHGRTKEGRNAVARATGEVKEKVDREEKKEVARAKMEDLWDGTEDESVMYDDLPVDITDLLDGDDDYCPTGHEETVELMNLANMRNVANRGFIPYGTTSSIWSIEASPGLPNGSPASQADEPPAEPLDLIKFGSISLDRTREPDEPDDWSILYETCTLPYRQTWSEEIAPIDDQDDDLFESLTKLNHAADSSPFVRFDRAARAPPYNPFAIAAPATVHPEPPVTPIRRVDSDDLLTSAETHFRPIDEKIENCAHGEYADGATFHVANALEKVVYRRTKSGLFVESDFGFRRRYGEFRPPREGEVVAHRPFGGHVEFVLKFLVCQNDKSCQTDGGRGEEETDGAGGGYDFCTCRSERTLAMNADYSSTSSFIESLCGLPVGGSDGGGLSEFLWKQNETFAPCDGCNNNNSVMWNTDFLRSFQYDPEWDDQSLRDIWSGGEVCHTCLGRPPSTLQQSKLREDISQDGDQLLSDLSSVQKSYMDSLPLTETACDAAETPAPGSKERKRRHSLIAAHSDDGVWSFASRLEEDCLIQMAALPTLRSVTL